jgi:hypothetical protein
MELTGGGTDRTKPHDYPDTTQGNQVTLFICTLLRVSALSQGAAY